jgi:hypothetical protein
VKTGRGWRRRLYQRWRGRAWGRPLGRRQTHAIHHVHLAVDGGSRLVAVGLLDRAARLLRLLLTLAGLNGLLQVLLPVALLLFNVRLEVYRRPAVRARQVGVLQARQYGPDALVMPDVRARRDEERLAWLWALDGSCAEGYQPIST